MSSNISDRHVLRLLVVDDDVLMRRAAKRALQRKLEAEVVVAAGGRDALAMFELGERFHVVVVDLDMPEMNGFELLERLHLHDPDLPVGVWSGSVLLDEIYPAMAAFVVHKSDPIDTLCRAVMRAFAGRRSRALGHSSRVRVRDGVALPAVDEYADEA